MTRALTALYGSPYAVLCLANLFWAGNVIVGRLAVGEVSPMGLTTFRWAGVLILLPFIAGASVRRDWPVMRKRLGYVMAMGALGFTSFNALFYIAAHFTTAVSMGILQGAIPGLVFLLAFFVRGTPAGWRQIAGMAATLVGVAVVATQGDLTALAALRFNFGDVLMLGTCLVYALYAVLLPDRPAVAGISFFAGLSVAAFLTSLPLLAIEIATGHFEVPTTAGWLAVAYTTLFPSVLSQVFFIRGVELIGPGRAGVFVNLIPVFASILAVAVLGESFHLYHAVALALVGGGILYAERTGRRS